MILLTALLLVASGSALCAQSADSSAAPSAQKAVGHKPKAAAAHSKKAARGTKKQVAKAEEKPVVAETPAPVVPARKVEEPPKPKWPINDEPIAAKISWDSQGLMVSADNSSLQKILDEISTLTGTEFSGFAKDHEQRIFGSYGPGRARDVLAQLLQGTGYNVMMVGDLGQGAPRTVALSVPGNSSGAKGQTRKNASGDDDDDAVPDEPQQPQPPMQQQPRGGGPGEGGNGPGGMPGGPGGPGGMPGQGPQNQN